MAAPQAANDLNPNHPQPPRPGDTIVVVATMEKVKNVEAANRA